MIKRPLNPRFNEAVLSDKKTTTIRDSAWAVGMPVMLYNWSGAAYRSFHINVASVMVLETRPIFITRNADDSMRYDFGQHEAIHKTEGFDTPEAMDEWFRPLVKPGQTIEKTLIFFRRMKEEVQP